MLAIAAIVLALSALGFLVVAIAALFAMKHLGLDVWGVLLWLGLAEAPVDELAARRSSSVQGRRAIASA